MKYLKKFENHTQYDTYINGSGAILPNVSICIQENDVHYNPSSPTPPTPTYETVDLGLPSGTKWAKYNVGATSETEYGNYYQYGKGAAQYAATSGDSDYSGTENPLALSADTAAQVWGGSWHIPTSAQCAELTANTTYEWTTIDGVNGGKFTAQNGNYIFIPAANAAVDESVGDYCQIWCSTSFVQFDLLRVYSMLSDNEGISIGADALNFGFSVRGVIG